MIHIESQWLIFTNDLEKKKEKGSSFPVSNKHPLKHEMKVCIEEMNVHINEVVSQIGGPLSFPRQHVGVYLGRT